MGLSIQFISSYGITGYCLFFFLFIYIWVSIIYEVLPFNPAADIYSFVYFVRASSSSGVFGLKDHAICYGFPEQCGCVSFACGDMRCCYCVFLILVYHHQHNILYPNIFLYVLSFLNLSYYFQIILSCDFCLFYRLTSYRVYQNESLTSSFNKYYHFKCIDVYQCIFQICIDYLILYIL